MSSSRRRFRRSDLLLVVVPALLTLFVLVLPSHGSLTSAVNPRVGAKQRIEAFAETTAPIEAPTGPPVRHEASRAAAPERRHFHDVIETVGVSRAARAPAAA